jgi:tetratricopeptide (TPR) repeat protein
LHWYLLSADNARQAILPYSQALPLVSPDDYDVPSFDDAVSAFTWYERERTNILAALEQAMDFGQFDIAWRLPVVSDGFFELHSYWRDWREMHQTALSAALTINDSMGEASARRCLGDSCWEFKEFTEALRHYERGAEVAHAIGDAWIEGFSIRGMGLVTADAGDPIQAIDYFERARQVFESSGNARGVGMSMLSLGNTHKAMGEPDEAARDCERAVGIFREISDRWSLAWGLLSLGEAHAEMGRLGPAEAELEEAIAVFREFTDRQSEATSLTRLAQVLRLKNDHARARDCLNAAFEIYDSIGDPRAADLQAQLANLSPEEG